MLDEYSIEQRATQIFDARSKEYFSEVGPMLGVVLRSVIAGARRILA